MKSASQKLLVIVLVMIGLSLILTAAFRVVYAPQLHLRVVLKDRVPDTEEVDRLLALASQNHFDLTDSLRLARALEGMEMVGDTLDLYKNLASRYAATPVISFWYAERLQIYGRWDEAEKIYLKLLDLIEKDHSDISSMASHRWSASEKELAIAQRSINIPRDVAKISEADIYWKLAGNAMSAATASENDERRIWFEKSERFFAVCLDIEPDNQDVRGAYANLLLQIKQPAKSLLNYQILLEANPHDPGLLISAAIAAGADNRFALAERYSRDALRVENRPEWRLELARFMSWGGKHDAAINELDALIEEYPAESGYRRERAGFLLNAGRMREYLDDTARLTVLNPLDISLRLSRIRAMIGLNMYSDAIHESTALLAIEPKNHDASLLRAEAHLWNRDYREAQLEFMILARLSPEDRVVKKRLAQSYLWNREYKEALDIFRRLNPELMNNAEVAQGFAEALSQQKRVPAPDDAAAILIMLRAITLNPDAGWPVPLLAAIGRALRATGETEAAVDLLKTAAQRAEANLSLRLELADLLQSIGRHEEAARQYHLITNHELKDRKP